jgi:hypothetical protein
MLCFDAARSVVPIRENAMEDPAKLHILQFLSWVALQCG